MAFQPIDIFIEVNQGTKPSDSTGKICFLNIHKRLLILELLDETSGTDVWHRGILLQEGYWPAVTAQHRGQICRSTKHLTALTCLSLYSFLAGAAQQLPGIADSGYFKEKLEQYTFLSVPGDCALQVPGDLAEPSKLHGMNVAGTEGQLELGVIHRIVT